MKTNLLQQSIIWMLVMLIAGVFPAVATTMLKYSTEDLTTKADNIVVGRTVETESKWNEDRTKIYTDVTIEVISNVKGATQTDTITIREFGGIVDGVGMRVDGAAEFKTGEECVLFLNKKGDRLRTVGMMQGKFNIFIDPANRKKRVSRSLGKGVKFMNQKGAGASTGAEPVLLDDFLKEIKSHLKSNQN